MSLPSVGIRLTDYKIKKLDEGRVDLLCQRGAGRALHTFSPNHGLLHRTLPRCGHTWPAGSLGRWCVSSQPWANWGGKEKNSLTDKSTWPTNFFFDWCVWGGGRKYMTHCKLPTTLTLDLWRGVSLWQHFTKTWDQNVLGSFADGSRGRLLRS